MYKVKNVNLIFVPFRDGRGTESEAVQLVPS
jgi:hypothetical protein